MTVMRERSRWDMKKLKKKPHKTTHPKFAKLLGVRRALSVSSPLRNAVDFGPEVPGGKTRMYE